MNPNPTVTLDVRQLGTPWAILKVGQAVRALGTGQVLEVLGSDPALRQALPPVAEAGGGRLTGLEEKGGVLRFWFTSSGEQPQQLPKAAKPRTKEQEHV